MPVLLPLLLAGLPQSAPVKPKHRTASQSAPGFSLDLPNDGGAAPSSAATDAAADPAPAAATPPADAPTTADAPTVIGGFTLDTPIRALIADPGAKAVLDKDLPGLSDDQNLAKFQDMSLRRLQPMTGGQLSDKLLAKTGRDLAAVSGTPAAVDTSAPAPEKGRSRAGEGR